MKKLIESIKREVKLIKNSLCLVVNCLILKKNERILLSYQEGNMDKEELCRIIVKTWKRIKQSDKQLKTAIDAALSIGKKLPENYIDGLENIEIFLSGLEREVMAYSEIVEDEFIKE